MSAKLVQSNLAKKEKTCLCGASEASKWAMVNLGSPLPSEIELAPFWKPPIFVHWKCGTHRGGPVNRCHCPTKYCGSEIKDSFTLRVNHIRYPALRTDEHFNTTSTEVSVATLEDPFSSWNANIESSETYCSSLITFVLFKGYTFFSPMHSNWMEQSMSDQCIPLYINWIQCRGCREVLHCQFSTTSSNQSFTQVWLSPK